MAGGIGVEELLGRLGLDRSSPIPLYYQLREALKERLDEGRLRPGDPFPTEAEISRETGLSRMTVRHALEDLKAHGLLEGRRGSRTVVGPGTAREGLHSDRAPLTGGALRSFTEIFGESGHRVGGSVLSKSLVDPPESVARRLGSGGNGKVLEVRRVRHLDGEPVSLETSYYPEPVASLLLPVDLGDRSVYEILRRAGIDPHEAVETLELGLMTPYEAKVLGSRAGVPVALCRRVTVDPSGRPVEFTKVVYRGDRQKLTVRLRREELER
jgi:GntR family transcriptional regulator